MKKLLVISMLAAATLLGGCGRDLGPMAATRTGLMSASDSQIGLPSTYRPGAAIPGQEGTPSLKRVNFPKITRTPAGVLSDPVNLMIAGSERQIRHVFGSQGWLGADPITLLSAARIAKNTLTKGEYPTAPMSDLLLYNRVQDMSFQKDPIGVYVRDHLRVWQTPLKDRLGRPFWAVAATKDVAVKWSFTDKLPTHQISPDIDAERQLVVDDFLKSGQVKLRYQLQSLPRDYKGKNGGGDEYFTDGQVEVLELVVIRPNN